MSETPSIAEALGEQPAAPTRQLKANLDFAAIARSEWQQYWTHVGDWERRRYLTSS
jgi:glutamine synthetase